MKHSIQYKILIPFLLVIFIGMTSLIAILYNINEQNTYQTISDDMVRARKNQELYLKQYFLINNLEFNHLSLNKKLDSISRSLSAQEGNNIRIYPYPSENDTPLPSDEDFSLALNGDTAYTVNFGSDTVTATLSFPIQIDNNIIGIIRYNKDYTEHFNNNNRFIMIIGLFAASIFLAMLVTSYFISKRLVKPIKRLIISSDQISKGNYNLDINISSRDEIGELANRFKSMANTVKEQIEIIETDRDQIKEAQQQTKSFFDNVTHEFKTPLTTILGYTQVIKDNGFSDKAFFDKGTSYIIREGNRLNNLVIDILNVSRTTSHNHELKFEQVNLTKMLRQTCDEMRIEANKYNIIIEESIENNLITKGDIHKLKEVIINLIDNSIKYGNADSTIKVTAFAKGSLILIIIKDKGIGIPEKDIKNLFEPFYRVPGNYPRTGGSTGLGLSIVKSIIEIHGGTIDIKSQVNHGTEVNISLGGD